MNKRRPLASSGFFSGLMLGLGSMPCFYEQAYRVADYPGDADDDWRQVGNHFYSAIKDYPNDEHG